MLTNQIASGGQTGKGPLIQRLRLWTGLTLFTYVSFHYLNHALGHISLAAMEAMLDVQEIILGSPVTTAILYAALITHASLGLWKLVRLGTWRLPAWEWAQILFGLAIPWFLFSHVLYTRGSQEILSVEVDYAHELHLLWPGAALEQSALLLIVWIHGCIGLHFWLRIRPWYPRFAPLFAGLAALLPLLSLTGWISAARRQLDELQLLAGQNEAARQALDELRGENRFVVEQLRPIEFAGQYVIIAILAVIAVVMLVHWVMRRLRKKVRVTYGEGTTVTSAPGQTLLEISRSNGVPHMSVCGGRARCSTCRTLIVAGADHLTAPTEAEKELLKKLNAGPEIRLACQCRVNGDIQVRPLIRPQASIVSPKNADPLGWGVERELAVLFMDIRGFSRISENTLPYDVVFILNSLFGEVGTAVEQTNGYIDKFMGDGMMALFGLVSTPPEACRDALRAALRAQLAAARASELLKEHLREPLRIGIGIHIGQAVVGRVGKTSDQVTPSRLTAIGDTVNVAARLEAASKELSASIVASAKTFRTGQIEIDDDVGTRSKITVRNISEPVEVVAVERYDRLAELLEVDLSTAGFTDEQVPAADGKAGASAGRMLGLKKPADQV